MARGYPVVLAIDGKRCVVVGGGRVAERKVAGLLESGARVKVVSPECTAGLAQLAADGAIEWLRRGFAPGDTAGAELVFAATDNPSVNARVAADAGGRALVNVADAPSQCTFTVPAVVEQGDLRIAISTEGQHPGFAKKVKERLQELIGPEYGEHLAFLGRIRQEVLRRLPPGRERQLLLTRLADDSLFELTREHRWQERDEDAERLIAEAELAGEGRGTAG
ncbi:MAG: bifunctional precorrin-2 dehydrogenase/sirohydrochlorin ferrochelatase [Paenibacillaceae bacterium]|jgi:precorrin-2 dehydrogenase/sirohydrochlorin ferrochelatase|nr:bifunctional precorrin-2 dehydrogenase/sirohydrochlorin ferrochelatase [Paenibacillaceae bacterium]